jgi:signal transduction histidine kinase
MRLFFGIRGQLTAGIVLTTLAGIGMIGLIAIKVVESRSLLWKVTEAENLVRVLSTSFARSGSPGDRSRALGFISGVLKDSGIRDFRLTDHAGKTILKEGTLPRGTGSAMPSPDRLKVGMLGGGWLSGVGEELFIRAELGGGAVRGSINFTMPLADIKKDMAGVKRFLLFYALLDSVIIVAFGVYFLSRSITTPIRKLEDAATRISGGALAERVDVDVDNEIQSLALSFNTMAERIENEIKTLERVNLELVSTQEELLRSSTLAAVGRLAAGLAHEVGNPLGAVHGYLDILKKGLPDKEEEREIIGRTAKEISRIDSIIREFLDISRPPSGPSDPVDVNRVMAEAVSSLDVHKDSSGARIEEKLAEGLPPVIIDEGKLRQVFLNLLINAVHSLDPEGGDNLVTVETSSESAGDEPRYSLRRRRDDPPLLTGDVKVKEYVVARITDTGKGIDEEEAGKIFEPFYTTKEVGRGTGLGLFVAETIVKAYGGMIDFTSTPGCGSTFTIKLPSGEVLKA